MNQYHVGYICGAFDLFHIGHLNVLERCKSMCDYLIVGLCNDDYIREIKHQEPFYTEEQRIRMISALKVVDDVHLIDIETTNDKMLALSKFNFDVLFSGDDWKGTERYNRTEIQFADVGVAIEYFPYTKGISTTQIKNLLYNREEDC